MSHYAPGMTHLPALIRAVLHTPGPVLEMGAGYYSTPVLAELGREVTTVEHSEGWIDIAQRFHPDVLGMPYADARKVLEGRRWGVVFLDHEDADRIVDRAFFASRCEIMVIHDTDILFTAPDFKVHWQDRRMAPHTSILAHRPIDWTHGWERIS